MGYYRTASNDNDVPYLTPVNEPYPDEELAHAVTEAAADLQRAMDDAIQAGLLVEPDFETAEFRSACVSTTHESYLINLQILRKLV
jgi:hypothetical protein